VKLDEFVKQTLLDITNGVAQAQAEAKLWIAPGMVEGEPRNTPQMVSFEIAVTVNKEGSGGVSVWSIGELKGGASSESVNRISFVVPVYFQAQTPFHERFSETYLRLAEKMKGQDK
jgi:hypothetical protein